MRVRGDKNDVFHGRAMKTASGLTKSDLVLNKRKKVVSKKQHERGKKNADRLRKHQFKKKNAKTTD